MKKLIITAAVGLVSVIAQAQTGVLPDINQFVNDVVSSPWAASSGYGRQLSGNGNLVYVIVTDNLVTNLSGTGFSSGPIAGYDDLWKKGESQINSLSGGWQFSATGHPFTFAGTNSFLSKMTDTVVGYQLVATPKNNAGPVGAITGVAYTIDPYPKGIYNFHFHIMGMYENRNGQNGFNGNWLCVGAALSLKF